MENRNDANLENQMYIIYLFIFFINTYLFINIRLLLEFEECIKNLKATRRQKMLNL